MIWFLKFWFICTLVGHKPIPVNMVFHDESTMTIRRIGMRDGEIEVCERCHLVYWIPNEKKKI